MDHVKRYFERDAFAKHLGMELVEVTPGGATARMEIRDCHNNMHGVVHGGAIFSVADLAFAAACNSHGTVAVALNVHISFLKPGLKGTLTATAREVSLGAKISVYDIPVTNDDGELIATFQGMAYRKRDAIEWPQ